MPLYAIVCPYQALRHHPDKLLGTHGQQGPRKVLAPLSIPWFEMSEMSKSRSRTMSGCGCLIEWCGDVWASKESTRSRWCQKALCRGPTYRCPRFVCISTANEFLLTSLMARLPRPMRPFVATSQRFDQLRWEFQGVPDCAPIVPRLC